MATQLTLTVPDQYVNLILDTFNQLASARLELSGEKGEFRSSWQFSYDPKSGETNTEFAQRVCAEMIRAMIRLVDMAQHSEEYRDAIAAIPAPTTDIPDEVIS